MIIQDNTGSGRLLTDEQVVLWRLFNEHKPSGHSESGGYGRSGERYTRDAYEWFMLCTYKNVDVYSDAEILMMTPGAVLDLYLDQMHYGTYQGECVSDRDDHNCAIWQPSAYAQKIKDAAKDSGTYVPDPFTFSLSCTTETRECAPFVEDYACRTYDPEHKTKWSDRKWLLQIANELRDRIYKLRPDLHVVVDPDTGQSYKILDALHKIPIPQGCQYEQKWTDYVGQVMTAVFSAILPYSGWVALAGQIHLAVQKYVDAMEKIAVIKQAQEAMANMPHGIAVIMAKHALDKPLLTYDEVKDLPADPDALAMAHKLGIPHPAMVCTSIAECDVTMQMVRLQKILNEWNTYRLIARRAEYDRWKRDKIRTMMPDCRSVEWGKVLFNPDSSGWACLRNVSGAAATACQQASDKFRELAAQIDAVTMAGPIPPEPYTYYIYKADLYYGMAVIMPGNWEAHYAAYNSNFNVEAAYSQDVLDRTDEILAETNWFDPDHLTSENLIQYVEQRVGLPPQPDPVPIDNTVQVNVPSNNSIPTQIEDLTDDVERVSVGSQPESPASTTGVPWPMIIGFGLLLL